jgi:hypothetical protein
LSRSLRKQKKAYLKHSPTEKVSNHLHLVAGEHKHNHTHSITPISADEVQKLNDINPVYVDRLFDIIDKSLESERQESISYYKAVEKEQQNDELSIIKKSEDATKAMRYAFSAISFLMLCGSLLIYFNHELIGGTVVTTVLLGVAKAMLSKKDKNKEEAEE